MEIVTVILQAVGVATIAYGFVLALGNDLGHAHNRRAKAGATA